jgi:DNA-binding GntR family transcriptional regulator
LTDGSSWGLNAIERRSTTDHVISELRTAIVTGRIGANEPLRESTLVEMMGTGRSSVREAIRHLVGEGLVEYRPNRGAFVRLLTERDAEDVYLAREAIEMAAVTRVLEAPGPPDLARLQSRLNQIVLAAAASPERDPAGVELVSADLDFHREMVALAGSTRLSRAHQTLAAEAQMLMLHQPFYPLTDYAGDHGILFDAIAERDPDTPEKVRDHLRLSAQLIIAELGRISRRRPDSDSRSSVN